MTDQGNRIVVNFGAAILLLFGFSSLKPALADPAVTADSINWTTYDHGIVRVDKENKPMVVFFYRNDCGFCKEVMNTAFTDTALIHYFNANFVPVKVNTESDTRIAADTGYMTETQLANNVWKIRSVPCIWLVQSDGCRIKKLRGAKACKNLLASLEEIHEHRYGDCPNAPLNPPPPPSKQAPPKPQGQ